MKNETNITRLERMIEIQFVTFSAISGPARFAIKTNEVIPSKVKRRYSCTLNLW
jgi:hypothetical protein